MKSLGFSILIFLPIFIANAQSSNQHRINAGYLAGLSRIMGQPIDFNKKDDFGNRNGFYFGGAIKTIGGQRFTLNFMHQRMEENNPYILMQSKSTSNFNYLQFSAQKDLKITRYIHVGVGGSTNINIKSNSKFIYYYPNGDVAIIKKLKGILIDTDPSNYNFTTKPMPQMKRLAFNLHTTICINLTEQINLDLNYHLGLTPSTIIYTFGIYKNGFYQSNLNLGLSYQLKKRIE
jgi:hypothetical protein